MPIRFKGPVRPKLRSPEPTTTPLVNKLPVLKAKIIELQNNPIVAATVRYYGITQSNQLLQYDVGDDALTLWNTVDATNIGTSPATWNRANTYYTLNGMVYGVSSTNIHYEAASMLDLWNGVYLNTYTSSVGWNINNRYVGHQGKIYGVGGGIGEWVEADSVPDLLSGNYSRSLGTAALGWNIGNIYFAGPDGVYGVSGGSAGVLYRADNVDDFVSNTNSAAQIAGASPQGYDAINNRILQATE